MAETQDQNQEQERARRKTRVGRVVSDSMAKTVVVAVERRMAHPLYGKRVTRTSKYYAHDEEGKAHTGDTVRYGPLKRTFISGHSVARAAHRALKKALLRYPLGTPFAQFGDPFRERASR